MKLATGLRRNIEAHDIGVWYDLGGLPGGVDWRLEIENQIDRASVFIALITENYLRSPVCYGELLRFRNRAESCAGEPRPLLLPLLDGLSPVEARKNPWIRPVIDHYQCIDLTAPERFGDRLAAVLGYIDFHMYKMRKAAIDERLNGGGASGAKADLARHAAGEVAVI